MRNRKERIAISIDPFLLKKIERAARKEGRSRSVSLGALHSTQR